MRRRSPQLCTPPRPGSGRIDVLVNNAGYGYQATAEEGEDAEIRAQFEANVFGLFALTRAVLPGMRARGAATLSTSPRSPVSSAFPAPATTLQRKHAVEGWSDALAAEGRPLGIKVTCVEPGPFRTDWAGRSLQQTPTPDRRLRRDRRASACKPWRGGSGSQPGDPVRAAEAIIRITEIDNPPRHLVLGAFGLDAVTTQAAGERWPDIEAWRDTALAADFPKG